MLKNFGKNCIKIVLKSKKYWTFSSPWENGTYHYSPGGGGTRKNFGGGMQLKPLTYTRPLSGSFWYPILD